MQYILRFSSFHHDRPERIEFTAASDRQAAIIARDLARARPSTLWQENRKIPGVMECLPEMAMTRFDALSMESDTMDELIERMT